MSIESFRDPTPEEKRMRPWEWAIAVVILLFFAWVAVGLTGCKSADRAQLFSMGSRHHIVCYSGGHVIYDGYSPGNISNEEHSDGWYWKDEKTNKLVEVTAPCVIEQL